MYCEVCNRWLTRSASAARVIGPVCLVKTVPALELAEKLASIERKIVRDGKTLDLFSSLSPEFLAQLEMMP